MELRELLFYGGIAAVAVSVLLAIIALVVFRIRGIRLKRLLDQEYGGEEKGT